MKTLLSSIFSFFLTVSIAGAQNQQASIGVTPQWLQFTSGLPDEGGRFMQFRRYALVLNPSSDGSPTFTDIRNIMTFYCAIDPNDVSYLLIFAPREIDVPFFFGGDYFLYRETNFAFGDGALVTGFGEVQQNQLFFDVEFNNRAFFNGIRSDETIFLYFNSNHRLVMRFIDEGFDVFGYAGFTELVEESIRGSQGDIEIRRVSSAELLDACR